MAKEAPKSGKSRIQRLDKERKPAKPYSSRWMTEHGYDRGEMVDVTAAPQELKQRLGQGYTDVVFVQADPKFMPGRTSVYFSKEQQDLGELANAPGEGLGGIVTQTLGEETQFGVLRVVKTDKIIAYATKKA